MAQQPNQPHNSVITDEMLYGLFIAIVAFSAWFVGHPFFVFMYSMLWYAEMWVIDLFTDNLKLIAQWMHATPFSDVTWDQFWTTSSFVGHYSRYFWSPVIIGCAIWVFMKDPMAKFKRRYKREAFIKLMAKTWPHAAMLYEKDPNKNLTPGQGMGPAMKVREFAKRFVLLDDEQEIKNDAAEAVFIKQLGPLFRGIDSWRKGNNQYKLAIVTLCLLKRNREYGKFKDLRNALARAYTADKKIDKAYPLVRQLFKDLEGDKVLSALAKRHAYEYTYLYSLFMASKKGVFAPNEFSWLKAYNRTLWYTLNSVDRRVAWIESAGPKAHWWAEYTAKRSIKTPIVDEAIVGAKEGLVEIKERVFEEI